MPLGRVAIIGAGPSGTIALDKFLQAGYTDIVVFERNRVPGGTWNLDEHLGVLPTDPLPGFDRLGEEADPPIRVPEEALRSSEPAKAAGNDDYYKFSESPLYPLVETNVIAELMSFTDRPVPPIHPKRTLERFGVNNAFRNHGVIRDYILDLLKGRSQYLRLNTSVVKAWQPEGPGPNHKWKLVLRQHDVENPAGSDSNRAEDEWYQEEFDFVYTAVGHFSVPNIPNIPGLKEAVTALPRGAVLHSKTFRDPSLYQGKRVLLVGAGFSNVDLIQLIQGAGSQLPLYLSLHSVLPIAIPGFAQPWVRAHPPIERIFVIQKEGHPSKQLKVKFEDGSVVEGIDTLILGTGYLYSYPFLKDYLDQYDGGITSLKGRRTKNLFWSTWWKYDASLAVAADITDSVFWRFIEFQGQASAGLWKRPHAEWPTLAESEAWEEERNAKGLKDFHTWWPHFDTLFTGLAKWGNYDPGDLSIYLPLFEKGFALKGRYWSSLSQKWLDNHPEDREHYEKVFNFLESRKVTRVGL